MGSNKNSREAKQTHWSSFSEGVFSGCCLPFLQEILSIIPAWTRGLQPWKKLKGKKKKKTKNKPPTEMTVSSPTSSNLDHTQECGVPDQFWTDSRRMRCWPMGTRWSSGFHTELTT